MPKHSNMLFCDDSQLDYNKFETKFTEGQRLVFDDAYRLAHLPLVAPDHPRVIATKSGSHYTKGIHDLVFSIAIPVAADKLFMSEAFVRLCNELENSKFARKLSWDTFTKRKNKLHATICGAISTTISPEISQRMYQQLVDIGPISVRVRGLFSGNINVGRLYSKVYPELRQGKNVCHSIQSIFSSPLTNLYVVGLFNFVEELSPSETQELVELLDVWRNIDIIRLEIENLWLLKSRDDLVLDGGIDKVLPLV